MDWIIKTLWIGSSLSPLEQLSLSSFIANGHRVELFVYDDVANIPDGTIIRDANEILSENKIFEYRSAKSYAGFANWFRYEMLYREGGVWVDTDVVCLKKFDFMDSFFAGYYSSEMVNNAVLGAIPELEICKFLASTVENPNAFLPFDTWKQKRKKLTRRLLTGNARSALKWGETGPLGLTRALRHFDLTEHVKPVTAFYPITPSCWATIFDETYPNTESYFPDTYAIHLWNEKMRRKDGFDKHTKFADGSLIEYLKRKYLYG
jgi:hypothetical protein